MRLQIAGSEDREWMKHDRYVYILSTCMCLCVLLNTLTFMFSLLFMLIFLLIHSYNTSYIYIYINRKLQALSLGPSSGAPLALNLCKFLCKRSARLAKHGLQSGCTCLRRA